MLTLINAKDVFNNLEPKIAKDFLEYFVQEDTWDFHVFRVIKGDYEGNNDVFTVEMENISKDEVVERMGIELGGLDIREAFRYVDELETVKAVIRCDVEKGFENWDSKSADTLEEAIGLISEGDFYEIQNMIYEDTEKEQVDDSSELHLHYSLEEAKDFLAKLLQDDRSKQYVGVTVGSYQNGREQGYLLTYVDRETIDMKAITFGQQRNSDSLIIYHGEPNETCISEDAYQNGRYFKYRHFNAASNYVFELLDAHAPKPKDGGEPFAIHPGIQTAEEVVKALLVDKRKKDTRSSIEGLQMGEMNGYTINIYDSYVDLSVIGITASKTGDIELHIGKPQFQGIDEKSVIEVFSKENITQVVDRIFGYIEEKKEKTA